MNHDIDLRLIPEAVRPHVVWLIASHDAKELENKLLQDAEVDVSRQTLTDGLMMCGDLMQALVRAMKVELIAGDYLQADETPVPVQSAAVRGRNHHGFMWPFNTPGGSVIFDFQMGRSREGLRNF